ncbi:type II secretion system F family protein [Orenia marismortui]|uniref:Type IV pilus assembly protein PilC n=1 Tax=Orenia marismortui TaxID=46469 RepID=A0A4R8GHM4_9FIRM|nr:type II secretion system F family protein [Orenia marismortui]TDX45190.1 type IV pilus assembly protein PilC [Orenia marismortui]
MDKQFRYKAHDSQGNNKSGLIKASNKQEAVQKLKKLSLLPISVKVEKGNFTLKKYMDKLNSIDIIATKVGYKDKYLFCRQLSSMLRSGIPIVQGLNSLAQQAKNPTLKKAIEDITIEIEKGRSLSNALKKYSSIFSGYFIKLVEVGETGGFLEETLSNLSDYYKRENEKKKEIISNISYPVITMGASIVVLILLMVKVLPNFIKTFKKLDIELPLPTKILLNLSNFMSNYWWLLVIAIVSFIAAIYYAYQSQKGRRFIDSVLLKIPILKSFITENSLILFARNLSLLERSGVAFLQSMQIVNQNISNIIIQERLERARLRIKDGINITSAIREQQVFPDIALQMIQTGEQTGELDDKLKDIVDFYEDEVEEKFSRMVSLLEPALIIFLTVVIGGIVASVILPIFKMSQGY